MATTYFGTTQADFSVDANGGATYRIQLEVPPGILKLEPHLALVYNSNTGNGTLGLGWQLEGLSMITRSPQTMAQDSVRGAVSYTENDRFSMDGKRLMLSSGTSYSAQDAVYHTELECWQQVVPQFSDVAGRSGPDSFVVTLPDGKVMEYGGTPDSAIMASSDNPTIRVWLLNRVTDLHGNYIDFSYQPDPGNSFAYLAGITYGGNLNSSVTAQRAVQFHYTARPDYFPTYAGGYGSTCRQLLDQIQTSLNGELIRTYTLAYQQGAATGRSQLISLTEADADGAVKNESGLYTGGNAMPATSLAWAEESLTLFDAAPATYSSEQPWQGTMLPVDVDGNGRTDLINVYRDGSNVSFAVFLSDGSGYSAPAVFSTTVPYYSNMQVLPLDVNGDGCTDLVIVQNSGTNSIVYVLLSQVDAEGNFQGFAPATSLLLNGSNGQPSVPANAVALAMDVDGDGLTDLVFSSQNGSLLNLQILFSDGTTFAPSETDGTAQSIAQAKVPYYARAQYLPMDFAGSGMTDLLYGYGSQNFTFCLLLSKGRNGLIAQTVSPLASGVTVPVFGTLVPVDINGDGLGDLVQAYLDGSNLVVQTFVSNGVTLQAGASQTFATTMFGTGAPMFSIAQLNGNGIPDLLFFTRNNTQMGILALLGNGLGFQPAGSMLSATLPPNGTSLTMASVTQPPASVLYSAHALPLDVDGDGITEIAFAAPSGGNVSIVVQPSTPGWPGLVRTITDGLGGEFQLSFSPLTDPEVYTRNLTTPTGIVEPAGLLSASVTGATFMLSSAATFGAESPGTTPTTRLADFPRYVLASYSKSDGRGGVYPTQCSYAHALVDLTGRGWLGFASMRTVARFVDPISQQLSPSNADHLTVYNQLFPLTGREASSLLCRASDGAWMQYTTHAYQSTMLSTGIQLVNATTTVAQNFSFAPAPAMNEPNPTPDNIAVTENANFDAFGNAGLVSQTGSAFGAPLYTLRTFTNTTSPWRIGIPATVTKSSDNMGATILTRETHLFDASMNLTERKIYNDQTGVDEGVGFTYDPVFGNLLSVTDVTGAVTSFSIESTYNTFIATRSAPPNARGNVLKWQYEYDARFGSLSSVIYPSGAKFQRLVDGLGRVQGTQGMSPAGETETLTTLTWGTDNTGTYLEESQLTDWSGTTGWKRSYLDGLQRIFSTAALAPDGVNTVWNTNLLDAENFPLRQSLPYFSSEAALYITWQYDAYKRSTTMVRPVGEGSSTSTWEYPTADKMILTEAANTGQQRVSTSLYSMYGSRRLKTSETNENGTSSFMYDALGRLTTATDPAGVTTTRIADSYGRLVSFRVEGNGMDVSSKSVYDDDARTVITTDLAGNVITQTYDALQRILTRAVQGALGGAETTSFTYDDAAQTFGLGHLTSVAMPNGCSYTFGYDAFDNRTSVKTELPGQSYSFARRFTPQGKTASITFPDSSVQTNSYNAATMLTGVTLTRPGAPVCSVTLDGYSPFRQPASLSYANSCAVGYTYDATGRLTGQTLSDPNHASLAGSAYRLSLFDQTLAKTDQLSSKNNETFSYDPTGRLQSAAGPYGSLAFSYDAAGNLIDKGEITFQNRGYQPISGRHASAKVFVGTYDQAGNLTSATRESVTDEYMFDPENRLTASAGTTLLYDQAGRRLRKISSMASHDYPSPNYEVVTAADGAVSTLIYVYAGKRLVAVSNLTGEGAAVLYNYQDPVQSSLLQMDSAGSVAAEISYLPFGQIYQQTADVIARKYTGQEWDPELNLYYYSARYYDPFTGRFTSMDNQTGAGFDERDALNRYCYGINDPINRNDPYGHISSSAAEGLRFALDGLLIGAGIGLMLFAGPVGVVAGSTLLGAGISGLVVDSTAAYHHEDFSSSNSLKNWGVNLGIGAAGGLISGGFAAGGSAIVTSIATTAAREALATTTEEAALSVGRWGIGGAARIGVNALAGTLGNGAAGFTTSALSNINPYQDGGAQSWSKGVGFDTLVGAILGGASAGLAEGVTSKLSIKSLGTEEFSKGTELESLLPKSAHVTAGPGEIEMEGMGSSRTEETSAFERVTRRVLRDTTRNTAIISLPGLAFTGLDALLTDGWHPNF